ncbi:MAG: flagellar biosynthetic protein FliO [Deltaproteobacteria bacterium]|nr:flagellar biosynthetic protein FliO [Deltaproteobacteria bacterium]
MTESYSYLLIKAVLTLVFVLGVMGAALYAVRHYMRRSGSGGGAKPSSPIKVLSTFFLGQKKNLAIVEVAGEVLVLGITPNSITCLTKVERNEAVQELKKLETSRAIPFFNIFKGL